MGHKEKGGEQTLSRGERLCYLFFATLPVWGLDEKGDQRGES